MQRGKINTIGERMQECENLARLIYKHMGYVCPESVSRDYMGKSQHPTERSCYQCADEILGKYFK